MIVKTILSAGCLLLAAAPALAENARLPYRLLYNVQKAQTEWNHAHTNLLVVMVLQSTQPTVKTSDLSIYIDAKAGKIPVELGNAGNFVLPLHDDLLAEDPWLITNQPRGTMKLNWQVGVIPGPIGKTVHYARLMQPVRESQDIQEQMRQYLPGTPKLTVTGLKMAFPADKKGATAVIHSKAGDRKLETDANGEIILPLVPDLLEEDPEISLSNIPAALQIISHPGGD